MDFYSGEYRISLDDRGRMRIPSKIRDKFNGEYVIYGGSDGCLILSSYEEFKEKFEGLSREIKLSDKAKQEALRILSSTVQMPEEDSQGRFVLSAKLKKMANINKKVVFLGVFTGRVEIWSEEKYAERFENKPIDMDEVIATLML